MCGIVGVLGEKPAAPIILEALKRLEYRGYDSAGIATLVNDDILRRRAEGKLFNLEKALDAAPLDGTIGIGHTRWATHGAPNENNAHPHATERVAIVHNGIIENFRELRERLTSEGARFSTETDSEVIAHLVTHYLNKGQSPRDAAKSALSELEGAFALGIIFKGEHDLIIGARRGCPLAVGYGDGAMYLGSDAFALAPMTNRIAFMDEGDRVEVTRAGAVFFDADNRPAERQIRLTDVTSAMVDKGNYRHFMAKEIFEQPEVIGHTLSEYINPIDDTLRLPDLPIDLATVPRITIMLAEQRPMLAMWQNTGSSDTLASRWKWISPRSSATARRPCQWVASRFSFRNRAKPPTHWPRYAIASRKARRSSPSSMSPKAPSHATAMR